MPVAHYEKPLLAFWYIICSIKDLDHRIINRSCMKCWHTADLSTERTIQYWKGFRTFQWMITVLLPYCANLISTLPFSTLQTLSTSLSHQFSDTFNNETAVGPPTLNSHYFSPCCPTALLQRRYRQSPPVGRRRRAKLPDRTDTYRRQGTWRGSIGEGRSADLD